MISIVIPALNEEPAIGPTVDQLKSVLDAGDYGDYEIIVVDDGSSDNTGKMAESKGARVIRHPHNAGYGYSLKHGITEARHDTIVIMDADATYPPDQIPALLAKYEEGFNMVVGQRTGKFYKESWFKSPMRKILKWIVEFTAGQVVPDINSGMRVFSKKEISPYLDNLCDTFSFTTSLTLAYMMSSMFVSHIPIPYHERKGETKVRLFRDSLRTMQYIVEAIMIFNPIKLFVVISAITATISLFAGVASFFLRKPEMLVVGAVGILASLLIFSMGLLSIQLQKLLLRRENSPEDS